MISPHTVNVLEVGKPPFLSVSLTLGPLPNVVFLNPILRNTTVINLILLRFPIINIVR